MPTVTFTPSLRSVEVDAGSTVLEAARRAGLPMATSCRGVGLCEACRVSVTEGAANLGETTESERAAGLATDERLGCQATVHGPVTITTSYW